MLTSKMKASYLWMFWICHLWTTSWFFFIWMRHSQNTFAMNQSRKAGLNEANLKNSKLSASMVIFVTLPCSIIKVVTQIFSQQWKTRDLLVCYFSNRWCLNHVFQKQRKNRLNQSLKGDFRFRKRKWNNSCCAAYPVETRLVIQW